MKKKIKFESTEEEPIMKPFISIDLRKQEEELHRMITLKQILK